MEFRISHAEREWEEEERGQKSGGKYEKRGMREMSEGREVEARGRKGGGGVKEDA